jgi:hypothetical protein
MNFLDPDDKEFFYGNTVGPISKERKMKKKFTVTLQDVTEQDLRDAFHQAIDELGVKAGQQIPADMYNLREQVMDILFRPVEKPQSKPTISYI